jgi:hypothetical protein
LEIGMLRTAYYEIFDLVLNVRRGDFWRLFANSSYNNPLETAAYDLLLELVFSSQHRRY